MHILLLTPAYPPFPGGGERYAQAIAQQLLAAGHQVTVVTSAAQREADLWQGVSAKPTERSGQLTIIRCPISPFPGGQTGLLAWRKGMVLLSQVSGGKTAVLFKMARYIPPIQQLAETLQQCQQIDLIHAFNFSWEYTAVAGWRLAQQRQRPFVLTPFIHLGVAGGQDRVARNNNMAHQRHLLQQADRVLVLTNLEAAGLIAWGANPAQTAVIGGGVDPLLQTEPTAPLPAAMPNQRYALFIGRASYDKGAIHAVQAIAATAPADSPLHLVLAGQKTDAFTHFYQKLTPTAQARIHHVGLVTEAEKQTLLANCQLLLLPSRTDSFGIVLLEAWQHGRPVIGAKAGGIPGVIDAGENGLLVPFGDVAALQMAIEQLHAQPELAQRLGENGRKKVQTVYNWHSVGQRLLAHYHDLLS